jgi:hypothetical protein
MQRMVHLIPTLTRTLHQQYPHLYRMNMSIINIPNHKTMKPINKGMSLSLYQQIHRTKPSRLFT